jgi:predicted permease
MNDLRLAWRVMLRNPGFTLVAVLSLALGIGANTTVFTLIQAVFLQPLPVAEPERLVSVYTTDSKTQRASAATHLPVSRLNYQDYRDQNDVFAGLASFGFAGMSLSGGEGEPQQLLGQIVTLNYFDVLGVRAALGRTFLPEDDGTPVAVLADGLWKRRFGREKGIVGRQVTLNNTSFTVVGIAPEGFKGTATLLAPDFWVPMWMYRVALTGNTRAFYDSRRALLFQVIGRLKAGVELQQAEAALKTIARRLELEYPQDNEKRSVALVPLLKSTISPNQRGDFVRAGAVLMTVVGLVLLIACANLASLLLGKAAAREREMAIRVSLGAGRWRLVRQLLTESLLLALLGGAAGLLVAMWGRHMLWSLRPPFLGENIELNLDGRVLGFTLGLSLLTGILFGLWPAIRAGSSRLAAGARVTTVRAGSLLVGVEAALAVVVLAGAGLFLRSLQNAYRIDPGFETERLAMLSFNLATQGYNAARGQEFHRQTLEKVQAISGVQAAAVASNPPLGFGFMRTVFGEGQQQGTLIITNAVTPRYFETLGIPVLQGRGFTDQDREAAPPVVVINQTMARRYWPGEPAVGRRVRFFGNEQWVEVVGVVRDAKYVTLGEKPQPYLYLSWWQNYSDNVTLQVRTAGDARAVLGSLRSQVQALDRNLPLTNLTTIGDALNQALWAARMGAGLLSIFGVLALVLAVVGIYGVTSYAVSRRQQEIGIRIALGAQAGDVLGLVVRQGMLPVVAGVAVGIIVALVAGRAAGRLLFDVPAADPATFGGVVVALGMVALGAAWIPGRRATKVDPVRALRYE